MANPYNPSAFCFTLQTQAVISWPATARLQQPTSRCFAGPKPTFSLPTWTSCPSSRTRRRWVALVRMLYGYHMLYGKSHTVRRAKCCTVRQMLYGTSHTVRHAICCTARHMLHGTSYSMTSLHPGTPAHRGIVYCQSISAESTSAETI